MDANVTIDIAAPAEVIWAVMIDVEAWPEWTASMTRVELLENRPFGRGSGARIKQPKLPATTWRVTAFEPGRSFAWKAGGPGSTVVASHAIEPLGTGSSRVTLSVEQSGTLAGLLAPLSRGLARRYVEMEAAGLKQRCESLAGAGAER